MQTIYLTDTDELPKRNVTNNEKPSMLQNLPNPGGISLGDMQLQSLSRIISIWMGDEEEAEKGEINGMKFNYNVTGLRLLNGTVILTFQKASAF